MTNASDRATHFLSVLKISQFSSLVLTSP
jgi:hypothetical protein